MAAERTDLSFPSGGDRCAAWLYRPSGGEGFSGGEGSSGGEGFSGGEGSSGGEGVSGVEVASGGESASRGLPCVVMAHGFSLTRHDGLAAYAELLAERGTAVLVFDHRYLGDSGGMPRQRFRKAAQLQDWRAAVAYARSIDGVDPARVSVWGFSFGGGHAIETAAGDRTIASVIALCPLVDGFARAVTTPPLLSAWLIPRAIADALGRHTLVPVTGQPGERAAMTLSGEADGFAAAVPEGSPWRNEISPAIFLTVAMHRPLAKARRLDAPVWVGVGEADVSVSRRAVERFASRAPAGELHRYPYDHFGAFLGEGPERVAAEQADFLGRCGLLAR